MRLLRWPKILLDTKMDSDGFGFEPYSTPLRLQGRLWNFGNAKQTGVETACGLFPALKPTRQVAGKQSRLADFSVSLSWNRRPALPNKYSRLLGIRCDVRRTAPDDFQYSHDLVLLTIAQDDYLQTH